MATVINNPGGSSEGGGVGVVLGVLVAIVIIVLFFVYGLPALRGAPAQNNGGGINVDVNLPAPSGDSSGGASSPAQ